VIAVQHHAAHVYSCMVDNGLEPPVLGISWDGTGYGEDGTVWGGEFITAHDGGWTRIAHLRTFRLPGGARAVTEPRRSLLGLLSEFLEDPFQYVSPNVFSPDEKAALKTIIASGLNSPVTSSAGRLFDAVASILGIKQIIEFEGQAAMELEFSIGESEESGTYPFPLRQGEGYPWVLDWEPMIRCIVDDWKAGTGAGVISARFHNTLVEGMVSVAEAAGERRVVLTGGCMQNAYLAERAARRLRESGHEPYLHGSIPPNDGGISPGQIFAALNPGNELEQEK